MIKQYAAKDRNIKRTKDRFQLYVLVSKIYTMLSRKRKKTLKKWSFPLRNNDSKAKT